MSYYIEESAASYTKFTVKYIIASRSLKSKTVHRQAKKSSMQMLL